MSNDVDTAATGRTPSGRRAVRVGPVVLALVLVVAVVVVLLVRGSGSDKVPYDDAASSGLLTLCDEQGHQVTGGSVDDTPLAPIVLGGATQGQQLPEGAVPYGTLYGYQPRQGVEPLEFSGAPIGGPVPYADPDRPATRVVKEGYSLKAFTSIYPAQLDGYVQLRLLTSVDGLGTSTDAYGTADIKIDGDSWKVVRGGSASCEDAAAALTPDPAS